MKFDGIFYIYYHTHIKKKINLHTLGTLISYDLHIIFDLVKDLCKIYDKSM